MGDGCGCGFLCFLCFFGWIGVWGVEWVCGDFEMGLVF